MGVGIVRKLSILVEADNKADDDNQDAGEVGKPYGIIGDLAEEDLLFGEGLSGLAVLSV